MWLSQTAAEIGAQGVEVWFACKGEGFGQDHYRPDVDEEAWLGQANGPRFIYEYDFGADWTHTVQVIGRAPKTNQSDCLDGEGYAAAEDTNPDQWNYIKEICEMPRAHRNERQQE
jgi:hypothetical protein